MTPLQKIELRASQVRKRLGEIAALGNDEYSQEDIRNEERSLQEEYSTLETRRQSAMLATSADDAASLVAELSDLAQALLSGVDANGDGRTGWQEGEGGLEVAQTHGNLMKQAEGL